MRFLLELVAVPLHRETGRLIRLAQAELLLKKLRQRLLPALPLVRPQDRHELLVPLPEAAVGPALGVDPQLAKLVVVAPGEQLDPDHLLESPQHVAHHLQAGVLLDRDVVVEVPEALRVALAELVDVDAVALQVAPEIAEQHPRDAFPRAVQRIGLGRLLGRGVGGEFVRHQLGQSPPLARLLGHPRLCVVGAAPAREAQALAAQRHQPLARPRGQVHHVVALGPQRQALARVHHGAQVRAAASGRQLEGLELPDVHGRAQAHGRALLPRPAAQQLAQAHGRVLRAHAAPLARRQLHEATGGVVLERLPAHAPHALHQLRVQPAQGLGLVRLQAAARHPEEAARVGLRQRHGGAVAGH
mmetsp:Transcript_15991/g.42358  ORF Transcript_15991/g.42358 Transcript_15991/m.42358 type:complete len:358 (-) Transcript_15991:186-1259(-)